MKIERIRSIIVFIHNYFFALISSAYLFLFGFVFPRNRALVYGICSHFNGLRRPVKATLPRTEIDSVLSHETTFDLRELKSVDGNVSLLEAIVIAKLIRQEQPRNVFEIGTFDGRTTLNIASNSSDQATIYTLDLPKEAHGAVGLRLERDDKKYIDKPESGTRFLNTKWAYKIEQLYGDSATFDFSPYVDKMDFVFVDGSHSYEYVLNDARQALRLLRGGKGLILWHDYDFWSGVTRAVNQLYEEENPFASLKHIEGTTIAYLRLE